MSNLLDSLLSLKKPHNVSVCCESSGVDLCDVFSVIAIEVRQSSLGHA